MKRSGIIAAVALFAAGIALLCCGLLTGEAQTVYNKAARICMECIGLG